MNPGIQVRKTPDGRLQARRLDGKPLTPQDREEARRMAIIEDLSPHACIIDEVRAGDGTLRAIKICSFFLEKHLWVLFDADFFPADDDPVFFSDELSFLKSKDHQELVKILEVKRIFPRSRVIQ